MAPKKQPPVMNTMSVYRLVEHECLSSGRTREGGHDCSGQTVIVSRIVDETLEGRKGDDRCDDATVGHDRAVNYASTLKYKRHV